MKITFHINYRTNWGEAVYITGDVNALGCNDKERAIALRSDDGEHWHTTVELPEGTETVSYRYFVLNSCGEVRNEWGHGNMLRPGTDTDFFEVFDRWQDQPDDKPYFSSAFTECIWQRAPQQPLLPAIDHIMVCVSAPMVSPGNRLVLTGEGPMLGNWDPSGGLTMNSGDYPVWKVNIPAYAVKPDTHYKFVIVENGTDRVVAWGGGENRRIGCVCPEGGAVILAGLRFLNTQAPWRGAGTAIPVFSIRTNDDFGTGDFYDLKKMIDWAASTGQRFIQVLPINDTTMTGRWTDSYPYNANSTFALHPMYLRPEAVGVLADPDRRAHYKAIAAELNALPELDYERVNKAKHDYFREIFAQDWKATEKSEQFRSFMNRNSEWLLPYAAFCTLRDHFATPDFTKWGKYSVYRPEIPAEVAALYPDDTNYACFLQFHLDSQMAEVHNYARAKGIALKGDIPIGISRDSVDAWVDPRLFNLDCQAGAPPDDFSILGQNWGFPTYNWEEMSKDGFAWWKARFRKMSEYFDAYRIDHVLGFFRIWQIPMSAIHGLLGHFNPALPYSIDELRYNYDFWIDIDVQTRPYIMDHFLKDFFGPATDEAKRYLNPIGKGRYELKIEFDTQRKIADHFGALEKNNLNNRLCEGLMNLCDEVLFIEDPVEKGKYHPRISAQSTHIYKSLNDYERWCFDRLYNEFFYHRHNDFWYGKAMFKLPVLIDATDMLVCAEDLGMIPSCVPAVLDRLRVLTLEIQRMPKDPGTNFGNTASYPYLSVCTTSTHDMGGIRVWWEENPAKTQVFYNNVLHLAGEAPSVATPLVCDRIIDRHLESPSMICILPLQDWLSMDSNLRRTDAQEEIINIPANSRHYWRYRMHIPVEDLMAAAQYNTYLRDKIEASGR